jgi:PST family polysaccharide transporter
MALVSAVVGPLVYLAIRNKLIVVSGIEAAGYWEAMTRISAYYLMFVSTIIGVYYLPKLAMAKSSKETKLVFRNYYKGIMPILITGLVIIYFLRDFVIYVLFTTEFTPVRELFFWQLLGDVFKAASMILGFQFFAARLTSAFIITELFSLFVLYLSSLFLIAVVGVKGVVMAHAFTYFIYLIVLVIYFTMTLRKRVS